MDEPFLVPIESGCQFNSEYGMWDIIFILLGPATMDTTSKNPDVDASFTETLTQLHHTSFVQTVSAGRHVTGISGGIGSETILNRSFPVLTTTTSFELLPSDPRPIAGDLEQVYSGKEFLGLTKYWPEIGLLSLR